MLILTRRVGETILIGRDIEVMIIHVHGNQVRLGITAPRDISVDRSEVRERKESGLHPPNVPLATLRDAMGNK